MENLTPTLVGMPAQSSKAGMVAVSVGLLLIGLVAGYFAWNGKMNNTTSPTATPTASASASSTPTVAATPIDTSAWKTYRDMKYSFSLRYPMDWRTTAEQNGGYYEMGLIAPDEQNRFTVGVEKVAKIYQMGCNENNSESSIGMVTVGEKIAEKCTYEDYG